MWNINSTSRTSQAFGAARPATGNGSSSSGCAVCWTAEARKMAGFSLFLVVQIWLDLFLGKRNFLKGFFWYISLSTYMSQLCTNFNIYIYKYYIYLFNLHVSSYIYHNILDITKIYIYTYPVHPRTNFLYKSWTTSVGYKSMFLSAAIWCSGDLSSAQIQQIYVLSGTRISSKKEISPKKSACFLKFHEEI